MQSMKHFDIIGFEVICSNLFPCPDMISLVEMFTGSIFEKLLSNGIKEDKIPFDTLASSSLDVDDQELQTSIIGPLLWSPNHFVVDLSRSSSFDEGDEHCDGDHFETKGIASHHEPQISCAVLDGGERRKRKTAPVRMTANQVCQELSKPNVSPHLLIAPHVYGESLGAGAGISQPFKVKVHPQVSLIYLRGVGESSTRCTNFHAGVLLHNAKTSVDTTTIPLNQAILLD